MNSKNSKQSCGCPYLERVVKRIEDHYIETNKWRCSECNKEYCLAANPEKYFDPDQLTNSATFNWPTKDGPEVLYTVQTTEEDKIRDFLNIKNVHMLIWDFEQWLRSEWKYGEEKYTEDQHKTLTEIRDKWYEIKEELGVNIDE